MEQKQGQRFNFEPVTRQKDDPRPRRCASEYHPTNTMEPSLIVQNKFTSTSDLLRQLAKSHYNELGQSDPNLGKTQKKPKEKGRKALQERLLQLWPRPPSCKG